MNIPVERKGRNFGSLSIGLQFKPDPIFIN